ncbi:MAG TPA: hypothetical protein VEV63_08595 [Streptosporangiaceae bacterium]|nr:hypothetical protein [Streptosporangiaceae bacterium]
MSVNASTRWREPLAVKVPQIAVLFWVLKVLTTAMGEAASDFLVSVNIALAAFVGAVGFGAAMWWQFRSRRYAAWTYWFAVAMVAVFGTMAADGLHVELGLPYAVTTIGYATALAVVFVLWRRSEGTLSIHSITTRRRETYYWLTVLATFALGTAVGDLTATTFKLGYFGSGLLFAAVIMVPAIGWWRLGFNPVFAFWFAYVITRPLGASFADWFAKPHWVGHGLGIGGGPVTVVSALAITGLVAYAAAQDRSRPGAHAQRARAEGRHQRRAWAPGDPAEAAD